MDQEPFKRLGHPHPTQNTNQASGTSTIRMAVATPRIARNQRLYMRNLRPADQIRGESVQLIGLHTQAYHPADGKRANRIERPEKTLVTLIVIVIVVAIVIVLVIVLVAL